MRRQAAQDGSSEGVGRLRTSPGLGYLPYPLAASGCCTPRQRADSRGGAYREWRGQPRGRPDRRPPARPPAGAGAARSLGAPCPLEIRDVLAEQTREAVLAQDQDRVQTLPPHAARGALADRGGPQGADGYCQDNLSSLPGGYLCDTPCMKEQPSAPTYERHRFPPEIIAHAVWLYCRCARRDRDAPDDPPLVPEIRPARRERAAASPTTNG